MVRGASVTITSRWIGTATVPATAGVVALSAGPAGGGAGAERDVDAAEHLLVLEDVAGQPRALVGTDAELGEVGAGVARAREQLEEPLALRAGCVREPPAVDRQPRRVALH